MEAQLFSDKNYAGLRMKLGRNMVQTVDNSGCDKEMANGVKHWGDIDSHAYILHLEQ